jgi:hypothetical protein
LLALVCSGLTTRPPSSWAAAPGPDALYSVVVKSIQDYLQTDPSGTPVLQGSAPYRFSASVTLAAAGGVLSATVRTPSGSTYSLQPEDSLYLGFGSNCVSQAALDAAFLPGIYTLTLQTAHDGLRTNRLDLSGDSYPNTPRVSNYSAAQAINPSNDFTLTWDALSGGTTNDYIQVSIRNANGNTVFSSPDYTQPGALNGTHSSLLVPRNLLPPGQTCVCRLGFAKMANRDTTGYPGAPGVAVYYKRTGLSLVTTGAADATPPTLASSYPGGGQADVPTNAVVAFTFDEAMLDGYSITWSGLAGVGFNYTWSTDHRTLFCVPDRALPSQTTVGWTLNPSPQLSFRDAAGNALPANVYSGSFTTGLGGTTPDVSYVMAGKFDRLMQTNAGAPVASTLLPPFNLLGEVNLFSPYSVTSAVVLSPNGSNLPLAHASSGWALKCEVGFASSNALAAAYPNGTYTFSLGTVHDGTRSVSVNLTGDTYPPKPHVSNFGAAQSVNPAQDFTLTWDAWAGGTINDGIQVQISDWLTGADLFQTPPPGQPGSLTGTATAAVIPRGTLQPGRAYLVVLSFSRFTITPAGAYPGVVGVAVYGRGTGLLLNTTVPPLGFAVTPSTVTSEYAGWLAFDISGLTSGQTVLVEKFLDLNGNGLIEAGEPLVQSFPLTDGEALFVNGVRNVSVPGDDEGAVNGIIHATLLFPAQNEASCGAARFVYRVSPVGGGFAPLTASLTVTPPSYAQKVTGQVTSGGAPVPYAMTFLLASVDSSPVQMGLADAGGNYSLNCAPGSYAVLALRSGYLFSFVAAPFVTVGAGATVIQTLTMIPASRTITGRVSDADTSAGLGGVQIFSESAGGWATLVMSDGNGDFTLPVSTNGSLWQLNPSGSDPCLRGYVGLDNDLNIDTSAGDVSGISLAWPRASALVYGRATDDGGHPLAGKRVDAYGGAFATTTATDTNGQYAVGVLGAEGGWWNWEMSLRGEELAPLGLIARSTNVYVEPGQSQQADLVAASVTATLSGRLVDDVGTPIPHCSVNAENWRDTGIDTMTDAQGYFMFGLRGDTWYLHIDSDEAISRHLVRTYLSVDVVDGVNQTNLLYVVPRATADILVTVVDNNGLPLPGVGLWAMGAINATNYDSWTRTGNDGTGALPALNGDWQVGVDDFDLSNLGFDRVPSQSVTVAGVDQALTFVAWPSGSLQIVTTNLPEAALEQPYEVQLQAQGGPEPFYWYLRPESDSLPMDLWLSEGGVISGIPWSGGTYNLLVEVYDDRGRSATQWLTLVVHDSTWPIVTTTALPGRQVNLVYTARLGATNGVPPYTNWSIVVNALPPGLSLNHLNGLITGKPTNTGYYPFAVSVTDSAGQEAQRPLSITVHPTPPGLPIGTNMGNELIYGVASDGTNWLLALNDSTTAPNNLTAQLVSPTGSVVGSRINLGGPGGALAAAFDGSNYLVVYEKNVAAGDSDLYGVFLRPNGAVAGAPFAICVRPGLQRLDSRRGLSFDGVNYFLLWTDFGSGTDADVDGQFISRGGGLVGSPIGLGTGPGDQSSPSLEFDGQRYLATWMDGWLFDQMGTYDVFGRFITPAGEVEPSFQINQTPSMRVRQTRLGFNGQSYLVTWNQDNGAGAPSPAAWDVYGRVVERDGSLPGDELRLAAGADNELFPSVTVIRSDFLVSWLQVSNLALTGCYFDEAGHPIGTPFVIASQLGARMPSGPIVSIGDRPVAILMWYVSTSVGSGMSSPLDGDVYWQAVAGPPRLQPLGFSPLGAFRLRVHDAPSGSNVVYSSSDLRAWTSVFTTNTTGGDYECQDAGAAGQPQRFYRLLVP